MKKTNIELANEREKFERYSVEVFERDWKLWKAAIKQATAEGRKKDANSGKTKLNRAFGKLGSNMIQVTVTGQLALLMLIEALEAAGITVVSANTDGLVIYAPRELDCLAKAIHGRTEGQAA